MIVDPSTLGFHFGPDVMIYQSKLEGGGRGWRIVLVCGPATTIQKGANKGAMASLL